MPSEQLGLRGVFAFQLLRNGLVIAEHAFNNLVTTAGKNSLLDVGFRNQTQLPNWYIGLVNNSGWTAFDVTDTMASHAGWTEFTTYSQSTRVAWSPAAAAAGSISNSTPAQFDMTGSGTLKGIFIASNNTKSGTSGTLWSAGAFSGLVNVENADQLKITYTLNS